jgi:hypothetical protein
MCHLKTKEELAEELCDFCPLEPEDRGVHNYDGTVVMCEGSRCEEAYEEYTEDYWEKEISK